MIFTYVGIGLVTSCLLAMVCDGDDVGIYALAGMIWPITWILLAFAFAAQLGKEWSK